MASLIKKTRTESDALGSVKVPCDAYYGSFTTRALANFQISGMRAPNEFRWALGAIKLAACETNTALGLIPSREAKAMTQAAREFMEGKFDDEFTLDVFQAGAGTPFNMNANEIIANRANELLGAAKGSYKFVRPNDHVNMAQSSNDVIPTAIRLAALTGFGALMREIDSTAASLDRLAKKNAALLKIGRTHLEDAVPITLGQEFAAYASALRTARMTLREAEKSLRMLGIGGTATGTGLNTHPRFRTGMVARLSALSGFKFTSAKNLMETTHSHAALLKASSALRALAVEVHRIANDLRLMNGWEEITLPEVEPGSSIMPGKVNPSVAECMNMICCQVMGNDTAILMGAQGGQLELNWYTPLIMWNLLQSIELMTNGLAMFRRDCLEGLRVNRAHIEEAFSKSLATATALAPVLGYHQVAILVREAIKTGCSLREVVIAKKLILPKKLDLLLSPERMVKPGLSD